MLQDVLVILGGIGLFIFGMSLMTEALRTAASGQLRQILSRFTTTPIRGVLTGTFVTALIQSSSATTVMVVGFVGAGLLSFPQALGVIFGANIGTTFTGWIVAVLGFKLQLGSVALPALFVASLMGLLGQGALARTGRILAGLCLLFIGLDMMQDGAATFSDIVTPDDLPPPGFRGQLQLLMIGLVMTVVMQSSSAALAVALVFLASGSLDFPQAATIVIGMKIGTTVTALLASIGGAATMRQTAVANLLYNVVTAVLAFALLLVAAGPLDALAAGVGPELALVIFHTGFSVAAALLFVPFTRQYAAFVVWLIPDATSGLTASLDKTLLRDDAAALDAAETTFQRIAERVYAALASGLATPADLRALATLQSQAEPALDALQEYMRRISLQDGTRGTLERYSAMLHQIDHLRRVLNRAGRADIINRLMRDPALRRPALHLGALLQRSVESRDLAAESRRLFWLARLMKERNERQRRNSFLSDGAGEAALEDVFARTDALRWLMRVSDHAARIASYASEARLAAAP